MHLTAEDEAKRNQLILSADGRDRRDRTCTVRQQRAEDDGDGPTTLEGVAAVYDEETVIGQFPWGFREKFAPGAFKATIDDDEIDVASTFNHNADNVLGLQSAGSLSMRDEKDGLHATITPPSTSVARDVLELVETGNVRGMSITFLPTKVQWEEGDAEAGELDLRTIVEAKLFELGPVTFPAYPQTSIDARNEVAARIEARRRAQTSDVTAAEERERLFLLADADTITLTRETTTP